MVSLTPTGWKITDSECAKWPTILSLREYYFISEVQEMFAEIIYAHQMDNWDEVFGLINFLLQKAFKIAG